MRFDEFVSPELRQRMVQVAREFRKEPTRSEALLWSALRNRKLDGYKFRRQQPIGPFVIDFYCDEAGLVVEVDGPIHRRQRAADRARQQMLEAIGLRVLRIGSEQVERSIDAVLASIRRELHPQGEPIAPLPLGEGPGVRVERSQ